jgi:hypothetical protein
MFFSSTDDEVPDRGLQGTDRNKMRQAEPGNTGCEPASHSADGAAGARFPSPLISKRSPPPAFLTRVRSGELALVLVAWPIGGDEWDAAKNSRSPAKQVEWLRDRSWALPAE